MVNTWKGRRKHVKHNHTKGDFHAFTFSCYHQLPLLTNNLWREQLSQSIDSACVESHMEHVAFVYMPEHVHLLVFPLDPEPDIGDFLSQVKRPVADFVKAWLIESNSPMLRRLTVQERPGKKSFRFWQEGPGCDQNLFKPTALQNAINYIHNNPVRRNLCARATDWKWSSARYYLLEPPCQQFPELPYVHGLKCQAFDDDLSR